MPDRMKYRLGGEIVAEYDPDEEAPSVEAELDKRAPSVDTYVVHEEGVMELFESRDEAERWAAAEGLGPTMKQIRAAIERARREADRHEQDVARIRAELDRLAKETDLPPGSPELIRRATIERPENEPKIFDSMVLYALPNYGGNWLPVNRSVGDIAPFVARSVISIGPGVLFEQPNRLGRQVVLTGQECRVPWLPWSPRSASC